MDKNIKKMKLYENASRIFNDLEAIGCSDGSYLDLNVLNKFDQLHYHGTDSVIDCINQLDIKKSDLVLEVGAGWGGPSRFIANKTHASVVALELQDDYTKVGRTLTERTKLNKSVEHITSDFLEFKSNNKKFDKIVSWLALYHIPNKRKNSKILFNLLNKEGKVFIEDLTLGSKHSESDNHMLEEKLFANSLVQHKNYSQFMSDAGFKAISVKDMSADWRIFTKERLENLKLNRESYIKSHGIKGYEIIEDFYITAFSSFDKEIIGGIRLVCEK